MEPLSVEARALQGMAAVVTGAGRGIGAAIACRFAQAGCDLVLVARSREQLEGVAEAAREHGGTVVTLAADLADLSTADAVVGTAMSRLGRLDVLVNNAGGAAPTPFLDTTAQDLDDAFHFNVTAGFELTKRAVPHLLVSDRAAVVNLSSRMDRLVARGLLTYGTVKAAMSHMTRLLAVELAPRIRVNGIAPGVVATQSLDAALDETTRRQIADATPLRRLASVQDVANTALWLATEQSSYITGKIVELDGGAEWPVFPNEAPDLAGP